MTIILLLIMLVLPHSELPSPQTASTLQGVVIDAANEDPIAGVTLSISGTTIGVASNADGSFLLNIPEIDLTNKSLEVRFVGYKTLYIPFSDIDLEEQLSLELEQDLLKVDEIVVTGQGINMEKRRLSTNITSVTEEEIELSSSNRVDQLLQSKIPNAQFRLTNGQPGSSSIVRARGVVSAFINSTPIIYVDGARVDNLNTAAQLGGGSTSGAASSSLADIPIENIERIEYINGGAATTMYGSDAANGVIQIFTKKGGDGDLQVSYNAQLGSTAPTNDYLYFDRTAELLFQTGLYQKHDVQVNGGTQKLGYSFSAGITDDEGFRIANQNENTKVDFRSGFSSKINEKTDYKSSFGYTTNTFRRARNGNAGGYTGLWYTESGSSSFTGPGFNPNLNQLSDADFELMKSYVQKAEETQDNKTNINRFQTSQVIEFKPLNTLLIKATAGVDYRSQDEETYTTNEYLNHVDNRTPANSLFNRGSISKFNRTYLGLTGELNAQHKYDVSNFSFISTVGTQFFRNEDHQVAYRGIDVRDGARSVSQAANTESSEYLSEVANYGIYFQENMGYKNRYFLEFGIRGDGNSAFGDNVGTQYYPKAGIAYLVSAEPFFINTFGNSAFSYFKIKANYGLAGNFPTPFAGERTVDFDGFLGGQAATFGQEGNPNLKPEKVSSFEIGADFGFVDDRIFLNANYYFTETNDALFYVPLEPSVGTGTQLQNVGVIENKGFEFAVTAIPVLTQDWNVRVKAAVNTLDNKVIDAGGASPFNINGFSARTIQTVVEEGYPVGYLRGNKGTFVNGVLDSTTPQAFLGSTIPDFFGSLSLNANYKRLTFFSNADFQTGAYAHSFERQFRFNYGASDNNEGIPQTEVDANGTSNWLNFTDHFVEKTDFFKIRTIGLNYTFSKGSFAGVAESVSIGFSVINPINFASSSFDPEATQSGGDQGQNGATTGGIAYAAESAPRQFLGSLKITF
ncbi:MAG: TonB-dependent receptor [Balneola sp.]